MPLVDLHCHVFWRHFSNMDTCNFQSGNKDQTISLCLCPGSRAALQCEWPPAVQQTSFQKLFKKKQGFWRFCRNLSCQAAGEWTRTNVGLVSPVVATATTQSTTTTTKPQGELCHFLCPFFFSNPTVTPNGIQTPPQSAPQTDCGHCMCMCVNTYAHNILSNVQRCKNSGFYFVSRHCNPVLSFFTIQQCYGFISPGVGTGCSELF